MSNDKLAATGYEPPEDHDFTSEDVGARSVDCFGERGKRPHVGTGPTGDVRPDQLTEFIQAELMASFEKFAEDWWAARLRNLRWQEEQDYIDELWGERPKQVDLTQITFEWPPRGYIRYKESERKMRTFLWAHDVLRGREVWVENHDFKLI